MARPLRIDVPGGDKREAQRRYVDFVADGVAASLRARIVGEIYLGDEDFIRALMPGEPVPEVPRPQWQPLRPGLEELCREPGGLLVAYRSYGYRLQELADHSASTHRPSAGRSSGSSRRPRPRARGQMTARWRRERSFAFLQDLTPGVAALARAL